MKGVPEFDAERPDFCTRMTTGPDGACRVMLSGLFGLADLDSERVYGGAHEPWGT